jgi:hypothetical protein
MALPALDLLACIVARRINRRPPFSALLTLWLSMIAAVLLSIALLVLVLWRYLARPRLRPIGR